MSGQRKRIGKDSTTTNSNTITIAEEAINPQEEANINKTPEVSEDLGNDHSEFYDEAGEFLWDKYEGTCPTRYRKPNPHIKTQNGDKVFSREDYAQELYNKMQEFGTDIKPIVNPGEIHDGTIYGIDQNYITVDIGYRELVYVKFGKESDEVKASSVGDKTAVLILEDKALLSGTITGGVKHKTFMDLRDAIEEGRTAWIGTVKNMIDKGGYVVTVQGINCFMPGSLAGINKLSDFSSIVGEEIYVVPVSFSAERGTVVVSHRKYLQALIPQSIQNLKDTIGEDKTGNVTGTAKYGVFVEFDKCLTGMIHNNDLDEDTLVKFRAREIKPGDPINFKVKDIISDNKITLTQKDTVEFNPWININQRYSIPCVVEATVKSKKEYGLFITIENGITGLLHVSEIGEETMSVFNPGDKITVQITRIDEGSMKVFLKMPQ
jgi:small subunit ribosomal protein S1